MTELLHDDHPMLDERLRAADPARSLSAWGADDTTALLARLETRAGGVRSGSAAPVATRRRNTWARAAVFAAAAALVLGLVIFPGLGLGRGGATAEASDVLSRAQLAAVDPPTRPHQYWRITTTSITSAVVGEGSFGDPATVSAMRRVERTTWVPVDGSRPTWFVDRVGPYVRQVSGPRATLPKLGWTTSDVWTSNKPARAGMYDLTVLPRDARALRAVLYANAAGRGSGLDAQVVDDIAAILREGYADAALRKALFEVLKTVPGIEVVADDVTLKGQHGIALGLTEQSGRGRQLIFKTSDGSYIGERFAWGFGIDATNEDAVTRVLVDDVDPEAKAQATRFMCSTNEQGLVMCRKP